MHDEPFSHTLAMSMRSLQNLQSAACLSYVHPGCTACTYTQNELARGSYACRDLQELCMGSCSLQSNLQPSQRDHHQINQAAGIYLHWPRKVARHSAGSLSISTDCDMTCRPGQSCSAGADAPPQASGHQSAHNCEQHTPAAAGGDLLTSCLVVLTCWTAQFPELWQPLNQ